ncbi:MAG TPA: ArsA-related P-loop ATPase [Bryobacteraceae bacterium]|nr:ArsA-related P-loop ATPase [Bryobacteraceae bacterium]
MVGKPAGGGRTITGKGGVGKTSLAWAAAVSLAQRGKKVLLVSTAAHVATTIGGAAPNLSVSGINPARETRQYTEAVMAKSAPHLDAQGMALLEEDLRSPCTEEIAVFSAFARTVAEGSGPTGSENW